MLEQRRYAVGVSNSLPAPMLKDAVRTRVGRRLHGASPSAGNNDSQYRAMSLRRMKAASGLDRTISIMPSNAAARLGWPVHRAWTAIVIMRPPSSLASLIRKSR